MSLTYRFLRALARLICWLWAPLEVQHRERLTIDGPAVIVANHRSLIDGVLLMAICDRKVTFLSAAYLFRIPVVGWVVRQVAVPTGSVVGLRQTLNQMEQGGMVAVFPEGGVRDGDRLDLLGESAAFLASRTGAVVIPVAIRGAAGVLPLGKYWPRRHRVQIIVGKPLTIPPALKRSSLLEVTAEWMTEIYAL